MSSLFHLHADGGDHLFCPHCTARITIEWTTEFGDPCVGEHDAECPKCGKKIMFSAYVCYTTHKR